MTRAVFLAAAALCSMGCINLTPISSAPPMTKGAHTYPLWKNDQLNVTQGVAVAVECRNSWTGRPCEGLKITSDDPSIAQVSLVHLDKYRADWGRVYDGAHQNAAFLVAGVSPGATKVRVGGGEADEVIDVFVHAIAD